MTTVTTKTVAIYARKSTEEGLEQDFNSLDAQRACCEQYVASQAGEGWVLSPVIYEDGGFSGSNTERPALKRLLAEVEAGRVQVIAVYKLDRLSRSLTDTLEKHGVAFVSVTQHFNTATRMGGLMLNILICFAQFERENMIERVRDKVAATRRLGKWTGGRLILGYDVAGGCWRTKLRPRRCASSSRSTWSTSPSPRWRASPNNAATATRPGRPGAASSRAGR